MLKIRSSGRYDDDFQSAHPIPGYTCGYEYRLVIKGNDEDLRVRICVLRH